MYEEAETLGEDANVYVHHELMLPAFPLCLAWLDCPVARQHGRLAALLCVRPSGGRPQPCPCPCRYKWAH